MKWLLPKYALFAGLLFSMVQLISCHDDCIEYQDGTVHFYTNHPDYLVIPATHEKRFEQRIIKQAHRSEGYVLETVTEQVLIREAYTRIQISDHRPLTLVSDAEKNSVETFTCYTFFDPEAFIIEEVPAEYGTRTWQYVIDLGTGDEVPAEYVTEEVFILDKDAMIMDASGPRKFNQINFRIPDNMTTGSYLLDQLAQQNVEDCNEGNSYDIVK